eukprot:8600058-Pyramimonas_sp.AAC.2
MDTIAVLTLRCARVLHPVKKWHYKIRLLEFTNKWQEAMHNPSNLRTFNQQPNQHSSPYGSMA